MENTNIIEVTIGGLSILFSFGAMAWIIAILSNAGVDEKIIKKVLTVIVSLGSVSAFLAIYIIFIN